MKLLYLFTFFITTSLHSQNLFSELKENIRKNTDTYKDLYLTENFQRLSEFGSPKLIQYLSSKQDLEYLLSGINKNIKLKNAKIKRITFGENSEVLKYNNELQCVVPLTIELETYKTNIVFDSGVALISLDEGKSWYFCFKVEVDNSKNNEILGLADQIIIPARTQNITQK
jgi:hypothetical protein